MFRRKWLLALLALLVIGGGAGAYFARQVAQGARVTTETVQKRDLEAIVSASGKIDPKKTVNISAQSMGRVTRLAVNEGDRVKQASSSCRSIRSTPRARCAATRRGSPPHERGSSSRGCQLKSSQASLELARKDLKRQQELWQAGLTTRESFERMQAEVDVREQDVHAREQEIKTREEQARQQEAGLTSSRHSLSQARFESPFDGIVTRRNVEVGENVLVGTMNNAGTVLLTIADMSVIEAEIEVDETDIPLVQFGQIAKVTIDAIPDKSFRGKVTEIGNSPDSGDGRPDRRSANGDQLQGRGHARRSDPRGASGFLVHRGNHDGDARPGRCRCRSRR